MGLEAATKALLDAGPPYTLLILNPHPQRCAQASRMTLWRPPSWDTSMGTLRPVRYILICCRTTNPAESAQRALYSLGLTGIPITNVNNNCSTGSTALYNANNAVVFGMVECALALGFERMAPGSLGSTFPDRPSPIQPFHDATKEIEPNLSSGVNHGPGAPRMFANAAQEYMDKYGATERHLAQIG